MEGLHRRRSGVYFARLTVPEPLRGVLGRRELIASTRSRVRAEAVVVAAEILAGWRRRLRDLGGLSSGETELDVLKVVAGSPVLVGPGYLPLMEAAMSTGAESDELLREAANGRLRLFFRAAGVRGADIALDDVQEDSDGLRDVSDVALRGRPCNAIGMLGVLHSRDVAIGLLGRVRWLEVLFVHAARPATAFVPDQAVLLSVSNVEVMVSEVDALRREWGADVTPAQLDHARAEVSRPVAGSERMRGRKLSEARNAFMKERAQGCSVEQARRVSSAIDLFIELKGDLRLEDVTREVLRDYRDKTLPSIPSREKKVRLRHATGSVTESLATVKGTDWPGLSEGECLKRMQWLSGLFSWLAVEKWIGGQLLTPLRLGSRFCFLASKPQVCLSVAKSRS